MDHEERILGDIPWMPETVMPVQWRTLNGASTDLTPEQRLGLAIIEDALRIVGNRPRTGREAARYGEARTWLLDPSEHVGSFRWWALHIFEYEADLIQDALRRGVVPRLSKRPGTARLPNALNSRDRRRAAPRRG